MPAMRWKRWRDFGGGFDLREGTYYEDRRQRLRLKELVNCRINRRGKAQRRPPIKQLDIALDANTQGLIAYGDQFITVAPAALGTATGGAASLVLIKRFDVPPGCDAGWELLDLKLYRDTVVALIRHDFPGAAIGGGDAIDSLVYLHVWDQMESDGVYHSWVSDPWAPNDFAVGFHRGNDDTNSKGNEYRREYRPIMDIVGERLAIPRADGTVAVSKLGNPRVWNDLSATDIKSNGEQVCFVVRNEATSSYVLPFKTADLQWTDLNATGNPVDGGYRFWSYTLQVYDAAEKSWKHFDEEADGTAPASMANHSFKIEDDGNGYARVTFKDTVATYANRIFRFKAIRDKQQDVSDALTFASAALGVFTWSAFAANDVTRWNHYILSSTQLAITVPNDATNYLAIWNVEDRKRIESTTEIANLLADSGTGTHIIPGDTGRRIARPAGVGWALGTERYAHIIDEFYYLYPSTSSRSFISKDDEWHTVRFEIEQEIAGGALTFVIGAGSGNYGAVRILAGLRGHLMIGYQKRIELWQVPADPANIVLLDTLPYGVENDGYPQGTLFDQGLILIPDGHSYRAINAAGGDNLRALADNNIGSPLDGIGDIQPYAAAYWAELGEYVSVIDLDGVTVGLDFAYSRESGLAGWGKWTYTAAQAPLWRADGATTPTRGWTQTRGSLEPVGKRLYFRHKGSLRYYDAAATAAMRDHNEVAGAGFVQRMAWHPDRVHDDGRKHLRYLEVIATGDVTIDLGFTAWAAGDVMQGPTLTHVTPDHGRIRAPLSFYSVAPIIESSDESGCELEELALGYLLGNQL